MVQGTDMARSMMSFFGPNPMPETYTNPRENVIFTTSHSRKYPIFSTSKFSYQDTLHLQPQEPETPDSNSKDLCRKKDVYVALQSLEDMGQTGVHANSKKIIELMQVIIDTKSLEAGDRIYQHIMRFSSNYNVTIFNKLIEMYFKLGDYRRAGRVFEQMGPKNTESWETMISALAQSGHEKEAIRVFEEMPTKPTPAILGTLQKHLKEAAYKENRASGQKHKPLDRSKAYEKLRALNEVAKEMGYVADTRFVVHDVDQEAKEKSLLYHSEKLAIAYGLISTPSGSTLRIIKNLRICGDCHNFIKILSSFEKREFIVRDNKRFHHFKDGVCSCRDFW